MVSKIKTLVDSADNGKMMIIPYDLDRGLGVNKDWNPSGDHMTTDSPFSDKAIGNGSTQKNPLFTKGILNANFFKNEYVDALKLVGENDMLKVSTFEASFNLAKSLYSKDTTTSKNLGNAGTGIGFDLNKSDGSNMSFSNYINKKTQTLAKYISGYTPDVGGGSGSGSETTKEWESIAAMINKYFVAKSGLYHYLSTAKSNYREYLKGEIVRLKKYFYVLRPLLACKWIYSKNTPPPILFSQLMDSILEEMAAKWTTLSKDQ